MAKEPIECCEVNAIHSDILSRVREKMPDETPIYEVSELFKVFGDSTRARIICALNIEEMCVCDLAALLGVTKSAVSHQLKALRLANLVKSRRDGQVIYYSLADDHVKTILQMGLEHVMCH